MPCTVASVSPHLPIELDINGSYRPGDTVSGVVKFQPSSEHAESTIRSIELTFKGRVRSEIRRITGVGGRVTLYEGEAVLFDKELLLTNLEEPEASPNVRQKWDFDTAIPIYPIPQTDVHWAAVKPFVGSGGGIGSHELPQTLFFEGPSSYSLQGTEAFVEYILCATVSLSKAGEEYAVTTYTTTVPVIVRAPGTEHSVIDFEMKNQSHLVLAKTLQLLPDRRDSQISFREKMRGKFQPSTIPQFACDVSIKHPSIIQLDNPTLPFIISVAPREDEQHTTIERSQYPNLKILAFSLSIECNTFLRTRAKFHGPFQAEHTHAHCIYDSDKRTNGANELNVKIPCDSQMTFDLGAYLRLVVHRTHASVLRTWTGKQKSSTRASSARSTGLRAHPSDTASGSPPSYEACTGAVAAPPETPSPQDIESALTVPTISFSPPTPNLSISAIETRNPLCISSSSALPPSPPLSTSSTSELTEDEQFPNVLTPTFSTYTVAQKHRLVWKLHVNVEGTSNSTTILGFADVKILGESEDDLTAREAKPANGLTSGRNRGRGKSPGESGKLWGEQSRGVRLWGRRSRSSGSGASSGSDRGSPHS